MQQGKGSTNKEHINRKASLKDDVIEEESGGELLSYDDESDDEDDIQQKQAKTAAAGSNGRVSGIVRWLSDSLTARNDAALDKRLHEVLLESTMFKHCSQHHRDLIAQHMRRIEFKRGDILLLQGEPTSRAFFIVDGKITRHRLIDDQLHEVRTLGSQASSYTVGMLHLIHQEPSYSTVKAVANGSAFVLEARDFDKLLLQEPEFSRDIIDSLCHEVRNVSSNQTITPLFLQKGKILAAEPLPLFAITCAASIESFYRSAMNALINAQLTGGKRPPLFPNMHIQVPTRVLYIDGFKGIRHTLESQVDVESFDRPQMVGLGLAIIPGLVMSPISSLLEANNAGHMNPEPLSTRWRRGYIPRCIREVIFGIGINQLSDFYEERLTFIPSQTTRNMSGSLMAGLVSGYLSHVPHNLSALKLLNPSLTYFQHFKSLGSTWDARLEPYWAKPAIGNAGSSGGGLRQAVVSILSCIMPKGVLIRTTQITGSFLVINSSINALKHVKIQVQTN